MFTDTGLKEANPGPYTLAGGVGAFGFAVGEASGSEEEVGGWVGGRGAAVGAASVLQATERTIRILAIYQRGLFLGFIGSPWIFHDSIGKAWQERQGVRIKTCLSAVCAVAIKLNESSRTLTTVKPNPFHSQTLSRRDGAAGGSSYFPSSVTRYCRPFPERSAAANRLIGSAMADPAQSSRNAPRFQPIRMI